MSSGANNQERPSVFSHKYNLPSMTGDLLRWDKAWEKALRTISPSKDVFARLGCMWKRERFEERKNELEYMTDALYKRACGFQDIVAKMNDELIGKDYVVTAWMLLDEPERRRHLLNGIKDACQDAPFDGDARALSPEITTTAMLKQNGKAFMDFARTIAKGIREIGPDKVYFHPSAWWRSVVKEPEPWSEDTKFIFDQLTVQRNEFIAVFVSKSLMSILHDLGLGGPGMDRVNKMMDTDASVASTIARTLSSVRDKPLIRCQNCTKTPEEVGEHVKFMVCSSCKLKLDFVLHYCSPVCQKADWRNHRKHCGKEKVAKRLPGTIHDPFWKYPVPETMHFIQPSPDGTAAVTDFGFGTPHPSRPHNAALQRQAALLEGDRRADYFLFNDSDQPIRFMIYDSLLKMAFRGLRAEAMYGSTPWSVDPMAEYLVKANADRPGLSRAKILAQLQREYGGDMAEQVAAFEAKGLERGSEPGMTFLERNYRSLRLQGLS